MSAFLLAPILVALVRLDGDRGAGRGDLELDVIERFAFRPAHGMDDDVGAVRARNAHVTREVLQLQLSAGPNRDRAVDRFGFFLPGAGGRSRQGQDERGSKESHSAGLDGTGRPRVHCPSVIRNRPV